MCEVVVTSSGSVEVLVIEMVVGGEVVVEGISETS
jgi:hypothetical protein